MPSVEAGHSTVQEPLPPPTLAEREEASLRASFAIAAMVAAMPPGT